MNPAMERVSDSESPSHTRTSMDVPDGTENTKPEFVPPVDVNDRKFIDLAKKIKKLSPETLSMIQKDLQPEDTKAEPTEDSEDTKEE